MTRLIYLDNNATTALHPEVLEKMLPFFHEQFGNPSSIHWAGRRVKVAVEEAREQVAFEVDSEGMLDLNALEAAVGDSTILISAMSANNETGTIFPVREIGTTSGTTMADISFSLGPGNNEEDVACLLEILPGIVKRLRDTSASS
ncbi:MAG: aminotransferase class V-fold PLP-dependent enzyme [Geobacter sp.]|nr:MAG: aminotransferase class V-fold PLP-dependent enzyme [Geobacter sp.]